MTQDARRRVDRWLQGRPVLDYVASRFSPRLFVPLSLLLCIASRSLASVPASVFAINLLLALAMLFQFRLWDDLSDRKDDLTNHPDRLLCRVQSTVPFVILLIVMVGINIAAIASFFPARSLVVFLALNAVIAAWYGWLRRLSANSMVRSHVVLLKYPVFVLVMTPEDISGCSSISVSAVLGLVYLCLCCYELLHDPRHRAVHRSQGVFAIELLMMAAAGVLLAVDMSGRSAMAVGLQWLMVGLGVAALIVIYKRNSIGAVAGVWCYSVFFIAACWLLNYSGVSA